MIDAKDEELADTESWTPESLAFRWYNLLHEFKTAKNVSTAG